MFGNFDHFLPGGGIIFVRQSGLLKQRGPVFRKETAYRFRHRCRQHRLHCRTRTFPCGFFVLAAADGLRSDIERGGLFFLALGDEMLQFDNGFAENFDIGLELVLDAADQRGEVGKEGVVFSAASAPMQRDAGNAVKEAACRVLAVGEET